MLSPGGGGLILYQAYGNLYAMIGRKSHLLENKQIPSVGVFDEVYFAFGRHLEELHVTWAHLEKKRSRLRTYTNIYQDYVLSSWRRRHRLHVTPSQFTPRRHHRSHDDVKEHDPNQDLEYSLSLAECKASEGNEKQLSSKHQLIIKGLTDGKASSRDLRDIQVKDIVKEVKDHLKTYSPAEMDIRCKWNLSMPPKCLGGKFHKDKEACAKAYALDHLGSATSFQYVSLTKSNTIKGEGRKE
ncbi:hypothetical protein Tco_0400983 [Tanacetum coccineum]